MIPLPHALNPFRTLSGISPREWRHVGLMFTFFFLVITTFWILKPVRTAVLLSTFGASELPVLRILSIAVIALVAAAYSRLVDVVGRCHAVVVVIVVCAVILTGAWILFTHAPDRIAAARPVVYGLYLFTDLFNTVMVAAFFAYLNDVTRVGQADRLYGPIGLGGVTGGIAGSAAADVLSAPLGPINLLLVCAGILVALVPVIMISDRQLGRTRETCTAGAGTGQSGLSAAIEGARLVWRNSYLLLIVALIASYEVISTMNDFVLNVVIDRWSDDPAEIAGLYGRLGWVINGTALFTQLLIVPALLRHKPVALLFAPVAILLASTGFLVVPTLAVAFVLMATDTGLDYSIQQSTKETLYVPLPPIEKYKGKAFIDMFVKRAAKAAAAGTLLVVIVTAGDSLRLPVLLNLAVLAFWIAAASRLGRLYRERYAPPAPALPAERLSPVVVRP